MGRYHMLGIGGIGVSAVARLLLERGHEVSGSDVRRSTLTDEIEAAGARVRIGHDEENIEGAEVVVVSTAIPDHNPELVAARREGVPIIHRAELLSQLVRERRTIGVTGTHGKGTVSSMITWILECAGLQPGFVIGARLNNFGTNARDGADWFVLEIDESDGTHAHFSPDIAVVNFLELDHLNYYDDMGAITDEMIAFLENNARLKEVFLNLDCAGNRAMAARLSMRPAGYAIKAQTEWRARMTGPGQLPLRFQLERRGEPIGPECALPLPGRYNVVNALAAAAVALRVGVDPETIADALGSYRGLENRFTIERGGGVTVVKDYNSHPTCMRKVLDSARDLVDGRIITVFKPYRYTLIKYLQDEYGRAFEGSDEVVITTMYAAEEDPIPGVDTELVVSKIRENGHKVTHIPDQGAIAGYLHEIVRPGDKVIFFGGDDFFAMADAFVAERAERAGEGEGVRGTLEDAGGPREPR